MFSLEKIARKGFQHIYDTASIILLQYVVYSLVGLRLILLWTCRYAAKEPAFFPLSFEQKFCLRFEYMSGIYSEGSYGACPSSFTCCLSSGVLMSCFISPTSSTGTNMDPCEIHCLDFNNNVSWVAIGLEIAAILRSRNDNFVQFTSLNYIMFHTI